MEAVTANGFGRSPRGRAWCADSVYYSLVFGMTRASVRSPNCAKER